MPAVAQRNEISENKALKAIHLFNVWGFFVRFFALREMNNVSRHILSAQRGEETSYPPHADGK